MKLFGRYLRNLRKREGFDDAETFIEALRERVGVIVTKRTVYAIERGEQMARLDFYLATLAILKPGKGYFYPAIRPDIVDLLREQAEIR